ncbi:MAG: hypothetical protein LH613_05210 [Chamaesiphon sp.]|nr:hypothetical protein [Chamaesiphon sp.]
MLSLPNTHRFGGRVKALKTPDFPFQPPLPPHKQVYVLVLHSVQRRNVFGDGRGTRPAGSFPRKACLFYTSFPATYSFACPTVFQASTGQTPCVPRSKFDFLAVWALPVTVRIPKLRSDLHSLPHALVGH